jgi:hypothetical protein
VPPRRTSRPSRRKEAPLCLLLGQPALDLAYRNLETQKTNFDAWAVTNYPLLAGGFSSEEWRNCPPRLTKGTDAAQLIETEEIRRVLANVRRALGWDERIKDSAAKELDDLVDCVRRSRWDSQ